MLRPPGSVTAARNEVYIPEDPFVLWDELHRLDKALTVAYAALGDVRITFENAPQQPEANIDTCDIRSMLAHLNSRAHYVAELAALLKSRVGEK